MSRIRKEDAPCCRARALPDGRPVIGFCSPQCVRRPARTAPTEVLALFTDDDLVAADSPA